MSNLIAPALVTTGQFCTVTFVTNDGNMRKINGRTNVSKYSKSAPKHDEKKYFMVWTRNGSKVFDAPRLVNRANILSIKAHGIKAEKNKESAYSHSL